MQKEGALDDLALSLATRGSPLSTGHPLHPRHLHSRQPARETRLSHLLEHLSHLGILSQKIIYLLYIRPRTSGNPLPPAAVNHFVMQSLVLRHGIDDGLDAIELPLVDFVSMFLQAGKWPDAWQHAH